MRYLSTLNVFLLSLLVGGIHTAAAAEESLQDAPVPLKMSEFSLSGYGSFTFNAPTAADAPAGGPMNLSLDELSLFGSGHFNQILNPFFEVEIDNDTLLQQGGNPYSAGAPHVVLERLYNDSYFTNKLSLRIGKMLSPVGYWNLVHAAPLMLTTTRPDITYYGFSEFVTGASLLYSGDMRLLPDMQVYMQPGGELHPRTLDLVIREYEHISGLHLNWPSGLEDRLGLSIQHAQIKDTTVEQTLIGFNYSKEFDRLAFDSEGIHTHISGTDVSQPRVQDNEWGAYAQGAYTLRDYWKLVGRYEYFAERTSMTASRNALLGVNYKTESPYVWKLEYIKQYGNLLDIQTGLYASVSRMF